MLYEPLYFSAADTFLNTQYIFSSSILALLLTPHRKGGRSMPAVRPYLQTRPTVPTIQPNPPRTANPVSSIANVRPSPALSATMKTISRTRIRLRAATTNHGASPPHSSTPTASPSRASLISRLATIPPPRAEPTPSTTTRRATCTRPASASA